MSWSSLRLSKIESMELARPVQSIDRGVLKSS